MKAFRLGSKDARAAGPENIFNLNDMSLISKNIIATVAYYDIFEYPLTAFEIWKYLIAYGEERPVQDTEIKLSDIAEGLDSKDLEKHIGQLQGFYFLKGKDDLVEKRIRRNKISEHKFKIIRKVVWFLRFVPFVRMVAVTGRMAMKNASRESDLDLLVALKHGRIFTGRTLVTFLVHILGKRRHGNKITDRICLNYFITDRSLEIQLKDMFSSSEYSFAVPMFGSKNFQKFQEANGWIRDMKPNYHPEILANLKLVPDSDAARFSRKWGERIFSPSFIEKGLKKWQTRRILADPRTNRSGSMIIANDNSLVFLPEPQGPKVFEQFKKNLEKLALD